MNQKMTNRLCIKLAADVIGIPQTRADFEEHLQSRGLETTFVPKAIAYLETAGFFDRVQKTAASVPMWKISARGAQQAAREVPPSQLDPMIWD